MSNLFVFAAFVIGYIVLFRWVLPALGVPT